MNIKIRRHGDVMIKTFEGFKIPEEVNLQSVKVLHGGAHHDHYFSSGLSVVGELDGKKYLRVIENSVIDHDEHGPGPVPVGDYYVEIKKEYDHFLEESRQVID